jgi:hypothetical protein
MCRGRCQFGTASIGHINSMKFFILDGCLIIPKNCSLPPVCVRSGRFNVPLVQMKWFRRNTFHITEYFFYFITPEEKRLADIAAARSKVKALRVLGGCLAGIGGALLIFPIKDERYSIYYMVAVIIAVPATFLLWKLFNRVQNAKYVDATTTFAPGKSMFSLGAEKSHILITGLANETMQKLVSLGPTEARTTDTRRTK